MEKVCNLQENNLSLQCVFHSIRFKVNNSARSGEPFFVPILLEYIKEKGNLLRLPFFEPSALHKKTCTAHGVRIILISR